MLLQASTQLGPKKSVLGVTLWVMVAVLTHTVTAQYFRGIPGNYCRYKRPSACCDNRKDDCSVPILGTLCYCDQFCNREDNPDCCPDYYESCLGIRPPTSPDPIISRDCVRNGVTIPAGTTHLDDCNECKCSYNGQLSCEEDRCMVDREVIQQVNGAVRQYGWRAKNYTQFLGRKAREGLKLRAGTIVPEALSMRMYPILLVYDPAEIPSEFDARTFWSGMVSGVRDQGWCGASWAFSTITVAQDRLAIESQGMEKVNLSPQTLLSCDRRGQQGCTGGHIDRAWNYLRKIGVVNEACNQYVSGSTGQVPACRIPKAASLKSLRCVLDKNVLYKREDMYKTEPAYRISSKVTDIQWEIMTNGPVQAIMRLHTDLFMYQSGVYSHSGLGDSETVIHAVRIVGWGEDRNFGSSPTKYWTVANSWGENWGEKGFFRIKRGTNESNIENFIITVRARLSNYDLNKNRIIRRVGEKEQRVRHQGKKH